MLLLITLHSNHCFDFLDLKLNYKFLPENQRKIETKNQFHSFFLFFNNLTSINKIKTIKEIIRRKVYLVKKAKLKEAMVI